MWQVFLLLLLALNLASADEVWNETSWRLPTTSKPLSYKLSLVTNVHLGTRFYSGSVDIKLLITEPTDTITLHSSDLEIAHVKLLLDAHEIANEYFANNDKELLIVKLQREFEAGTQLNLLIDFSGQLNNKTMRRTEYYSVPRTPEKKVRFLMDGH